MLALKTKNVQKSDVRFELTSAARALIDRGPQVCKSLEEILKASITTFPDDVRTNVENVLKYAADFFRNLPAYRSIG